MLVTSDSRGSSSCLGAWREAALLLLVETTAEAVTTLPIPTKYFTRPNYGNKLLQPK